MHKTEVLHAPDRHRREIDGLRAVAVLPVVWFHSGLPGMPGGFAGVDVFFVISGFLITSIIHREVGAGSFRLAYFYERRFRRIAPPLLLVTGATVVAAFALLLPYELDQFATSAIAAVAMVPNILFWRTAGYFALAEQSLPLLHTWSLGVEEQFYLLFPAAFLLAWRLRMTKAAIAAVCMASLLLCVFATYQWPAAAFYLLPTRGWELMIGAALAVGSISIPDRIKHAAGVAGLALIAAGVMVLSAQDDYPGWRALVPTLGAALVLGGGSTGPAAKILSAAPAVYIGRISYSLYLWHWPIFVFLRHWQADPRLTPALSLAGIACAIALSAASYRWVEQPARNRSAPFRPLAIACAAGAAAIVIACAFAIIGRGLPQRLPQRVVALAEARNAHAPLARTCTDVGFDFAIDNCRLGRRGRPRFVLWGDSHAGAVSEGVAAGLGTPGVVMSLGGCVPALRSGSSASKVGNRPRCADFNAATLDYIDKNPEIRTIVLSAYWSSVGSEEELASWHSIQQLVDRLNESGRLVIVLAGVSDPDVDVPWASAIRERFGRPALIVSCSKDRPLALAGVTIVDVSAEFCRRPPHDLFTDSNHPSRYAGLAIIAPAIRAAVTAD